MPPSSTGRPWTGPSPASIVERWSCSARSARTTFVGVRAGHVLPGEAGEGRRRVRRPGERLVVGSAGGGWPGSGRAGAGQPTRPRRDNGYRLVSSDRHRHRDRPCVAAGRPRAGSPPSLLTRRHEQPGVGPRPARTCAVRRAVPRCGHRRRRGPRRWRQRPGRPRRAGPADAQVGPDVLLHAGDHDDVESAADRPAGGGDTLCRRASEARACPQDAGVDEVFEEHDRRGRRGALSTALRGGKEATTASRLWLASSATMPVPATARTNTVARLPRCQSPPSSSSIGRRRRIPAGGAGFRRSPPPGGRCGCRSGRGRPGGERLDEQLVRAAIAVARELVLLAQRGPQASERDRVEAAELSAEELDRRLRIERFAASSVTSRAR